MTTEAAAPPKAFDSVTGYLSWDHDRLDAILQSVRARVEAGEWEAARREYAPFYDGLDRHIRLEEGILFPLFEERTGTAAGGPTAVMKEEHREIRGALETMRDAMERADARLFEEGLARLLSVLPDHNVKEEQVLYPTTDRILPEKDRAALAARLQRE
jgi:iron-sulfur cluster repair protein YtfE (RIC family)